MTHYLQSNGSRVAFHMDLYLVYCYFCYISMTWPKHQMLYLQSYLPMALICLFQEKNLGDLVVKMNGEIVKVVDWLTINKLFIILKKTHLIIFRKSRQRLNLENGLFSDNIKIEMKTHTIFLGVLVDQKLILEEHCKFIKGKIARGIGILHKGKHITLFYVAHYAMGLYFFRIFLTRLWNYRKWLYALLMDRENDHTAQIFEKYELLNINYLYILI